MSEAGAPDILVDTDGGLDDVMAVRTIAAQRRLWAVTTTWGNVSAADAARNIALTVPDAVNTYGIAALGYTAEQDIDDIGLPVAFAGPVDA